MCGVVGYFGRTSDTIFSEKQWDMALQSLHHRGPDNIGSYSKLSPNEIRLGHKRLSIIE